MDPVAEKVISYYLTKLIDHIGKKLKDDIGKQVKPIQNNIEELKSIIGELPSVCLIGLGSCGTNICSDVNKIIIESKSSEGKEMISGQQNRPFFEFFWRNKAKELSPFINVSTEPLIFIIDLDSKTIEEHRKEKLKEKNIYKKFIPVEVDWPGGAGNVQILGEYQARKLLTLHPDLISSSSNVSGQSDNWKHAFSFLIDAISLSLNPARMYFYIFSTGGGTGSGMSTEFGWAQMYAKQWREKEFGEYGSKIKLSTSSTINNGENQESVLSITKAPIFSCGIGILPEIPDYEKITEATHLNSGRLLCKFLSLVYKNKSENPDRIITNSNNENSVASSKIESVEEKVEDPFDHYNLPYNALILVSNQSLISSLTSEKSQSTDNSDFFGISNTYVAQQLFNLIIAQKRIGDSSDDSDDSDDSSFDLLDNDKLDPTDLVTSIYGLNAVAYSERTPEKPDVLVSMLIDSLKPPRIIQQKDGKPRGIVGISILPRELKKYILLFEDKDDNAIYDGLSTIPMFQRASSTISVISIPLDFELKAKELRDLKKMYSKIFPNAKVRRYCRVRSYNNSISITTYISGNSVILSYDCLSLLASYLRRCFANSSESEDKVVDLLYNGLNDTSRDFDSIKSELIKIIRETEDLSQFSASPFKHIKSRHEAHFKAMHKEGNGNFIKVEELSLRNNDVIATFKVIYDAWRHEIRKTETPDI